MTEGRARAATRAFACAAALALGGCSVLDTMLGPEDPGPLPVRPSSPSAPSGPSAAVPRAPAAPPGEAGRLVGLDPAAVQRALGEASFKRNDGPGSMWRYDADNCSFFVFFYPEREGLRASSIQANPRPISGRTSTESCYARVVAMRRGAPAG